MNDERRMEAEKRYISSEITLAALAREMGLPLNTLKVWCKKYNWVKERQKAQKRTMRKAITRVTDKKAKDLAKLLEASGEMEKALLASARTIAKMAEEKPEVFALTQSGVVLDYSKSLEKLASTRAMTGGAMSEADRQKLELLRREQERKEKADGDKGAAEIRVTYSGPADMEAYNE